MSQAPLVFGAPDIQADDIAQVLAVLQSGWLGTGPRVAAFEAQFAAFKGVDPRQVVAVNSGTAALHLSLLAAGISPGDEVITSPLTFCATVNVILHVGATPVLADVDADTMNLSATSVAARITPRTRAVLPVHFAGRPCEMDALLALTRARNLVVVEDCAHAIEARWREQPTGTLGDFGCFSFYATKNVTTGEGGMVIARDVAHAQRMRRLSLHGVDRDAWKRFSADGYPHYDVTDCGFKFNMMDLQAAIGQHQLARVQANSLRRQAIWQQYQAAFAGLPLTCPAQPDAHTVHARHLYTLLVDEARCGVSRDVFLARMLGQGIGVGVHYRAIPEHSYYQQSLGWQPADTPVATAIGRQTVSLPLGPGMGDADVQRVMAGVRQALEMT